MLSCYFTKSVIFYTFESIFTLTPPSLSRVMWLWASLLWLERHQGCLLPLETGGCKRHLNTWTGPYHRKSIGWILTFCHLPFVSLLCLFILNGYSDISNLWLHFLIRLRDLACDDNLNIGYFLLDTGYVMHINGTQEGGLVPIANLKYSVDNLAALGCQIRYSKWFVF